MNKLSGLILLLLLISSCKKETSDFIWERSFGEGDALFVMSAPDSGIISCGEKAGNPYFIKLLKNKSIDADFTSGRKGLFSSVWYGDSCFVAGGGSDGKMLLTRIDKDGIQIWDTVISAGFNIELTTLSYTGEGTLLALGSAAPSSSEKGASGLLFIRIDTAGNIFEEISSPDAEFVSANNFTTDNQGNVFIALTRKTGSAKTRACVARYNSDLQKLWETELYNNKSFGAVSYGVLTDQNSNVYITGKTEVSREEGTLDNSFLACLDSKGEVIWKKYLENSNSGAAIVIDDSDRLWMLNKNCFIISKFSIDATDPGNITDGGLIRMFSVCDSYNTDAFGADMDLHYDRNILTSGSRGGNFFLAIKSSSQ
jgi:hypothetical protein